MRGYGKNCFSAHNPDPLQLRLRGVMERVVSLPIILIRFGFACAGLWAVAYAGQRMPCTCLMLRPGLRTGAGWRYPRERLRIRSGAVRGNSPETPRGEERLWRDRDEKDARQAQMRVGRSGRARARPTAQPPNSRERKQPTGIKSSTVRGPLERGGACTTTRRIFQEARRTAGPTGIKIRNPRERKLRSASA